MALRVVLFFGLVAAVASAVKFPVVKLEQGKLLGAVYEKDVATFKGVPYAAAPVNDLRWQPPGPAPAWSKIRSGLEYGNNCISTKGDYVSRKLSEDCLYLNIWTPDSALGNTSAPTLPVMVFLYGGSWEYGGTSFPVYDATEFVATESVVFVTVNYRLGPFGFLGSPQLAATTPDHSTGNFGIQDQRAALQWVQRNIAAFGGRADRVFLFGESAGAGSVTNHLIMPRSAGLFYKAGMESGPPTDWSSMTLAQASAEFDRLTNATGCAGADPVGCLRKLNATYILANERENSTLLLDWAPIRDGVELPLHATPQQLWEQGKFNPVPGGILIGSNNDEGTAFRSVAPEVKSQSDYEAWVMHDFGPSLGPKVLALYPYSDYSSGGFATSAVFGDAQMRCPSRRGAQWATAQNISAYLYHFERVPTLIKAFDSTLGCTHAAEVPFVFRFNALLVGQDDHDLGITVSDLWARFAHQEPDGSLDGLWQPVQQLPVWPLFNSSNALLRINVTSAPAVNFRQDKCDLWDKVHAAGCQTLTCPCYCNI